MKLQGTFSARASRESVFAFLLSPNQLSRCIDDPHTIDILDAERFKGTLKSGIGPIKGTFSWSATVVERVPPERARIKVHGSGMGSAFDIDATMGVQEGSGRSTVVWRADVILSGTIASLGARLMQAAIDKKTNAFFENARKMLESP